MRDFKRHTSKKIGELLEADNEEPEGWKYSTARNWFNDKCEIVSIFIGNG